MSSPAKAEGRIRFGTFEVDPLSGELWKSDRKIRIQEQPFRILVLLLDRPGEIVSRDYIIQRLWPPPKKRTILRREDMDVQPRRRLAGHAV